MINCKSCQKPIYEGEKVLLIQQHDGEIIVHKRFECLLGVDGIGEGVGSFEGGAE